MVVVVGQHHRTHGLMSMQHNHRQFTTVHHKHLTVNGRPQSFLQLLKNLEHVQTLLWFIEEMRACTKPWAEWELG